MAEKTTISDDEILSAFKGEQSVASEPVYTKEEEKGISDEALLSAFKNETPSGQSESLLGSTGNTLSMGGQIVEPPGPSLVASGALGSGKFSPIPVGPKGKFDEYAGITDPDTRKGIASSFLSKITDPRDLEEISEKIPWYDMSENPVQTDSLFLYKWNKPTDPLEIAVGAAKAGVGMLESLPPLVAGAGRLAKDALGAALYVGDPTNFGKGRTLTEEQKRGMTEQQIRDAELSDRDKLIRSSRAFGDAALLAEEQLRGAVSNFAKNKGMLWDKGRVAFANATANLGDPEVAPAISVEEENARREAASAQAMADARENFAKRLNAKHVEHMHKEKNPAVLARELEAAWQVPAVKNFATNVVELLMPSAEDYAPGFGGDLQAAKAARAADAAAAAEAGVQAAVTESNRLAEDPEQVGAIAMVTPLNVFGLGGKIVQQAGQLTRSIQRGVQAATKTPQALNAARSADAASRSAQMLEQARILEQPGMLERSLGNVADTIDRSKAAFENLPKAVKYAGSTLLGAGAGALASDDPLAGALQGAGAGAGIQLGGKALAAAPRLGQQLLKAGRMSGAEMGRFEALGKMEAASPEVQRFLKWSQKAGGGKALDFIEKNANVFVQHNVQMLPMMVALGVLEDKDAKELGEMWAEFATYGFIHGQVLGGILGNDPVRMRMDREANMRQAQRVLLASSPTTRENILNLNWDRVVEQSALRMERAQAAYTAQLEADPSSPETAKAKSDYDFARNLHRENLTAPPEARFAFEDGIKMSLAKASNLINGILTPGSNMNIELLTTQQIIQKMIDSNPNYNGVGAPMTVEQALKKNPGADGSKIGKGMDAKGFMIDPAKDTVFINIDNALTKANLTGDAIPNVITHEVVGHGLFARQEYRERIAPLFNKLFGTEVVDENGDWKQVTPAEPGLSRDELYKRFFNKYLEGKSPKEVASYAEAAGVWDEKNNTFNINEIVKLMREEVLAEAHAGQFHGDPESPAQQALNWMASRVSGENVKAALNHLYSVAGPAVYKQWTSGAVGVTYSPEVMRAIRKVENEMRKYDGDFTDAEPGEAVTAPITQKDVKKSKELLDKYFKDSGKFETTPVIIVTDAEGNVVQTVQPANKEASEGTWTYHQDEATGDNVPNKERGHGEIPPEVAGIDVPVGGRVEVRRQIAYDESTGKPKERKNKETAEYLKRRVQMLRDAIDNAGDPSEIGRFKAIPTKSGEGEEEGDMRYTGKLTREQRDAIAALPESIVPASMKDLLFKYDDLITRGDGTVLDIDYAARLNAKGGYEAFSPRIRQVVPLRLHLSKDGNFYVKAWDLSALRRKVELYKKYAPGVFAPWGGDTEAFWKEFRTRLLPKLAEKPDAERIRQDISDSFPDLSREQVDQRVAEVYAQKLNEPAWTVLDGDPETQRLKRTIYAKMIGDPNPNIPDVESIPDIPKEKLSRSERKIDKKSPLAQIIKSYRLDAHTAAEENANTEFKYPIPYKARFLPEQEQTPQEEQRPAFSGGILKGLQAVSAKYSPTGTGEIRATVQPAEIVSQETQAPETLRTPIDQIYDTTATTVPTGDRGRGRAAGEYTPLEGAPRIEGATGPDPRLNAVFERYARSKGIPIRRQAEYVTVDPERAKRIAAAYEAMPHAPNDPAVREAYSDLINQTRDQYDALVDAGYKAWFMDPDADPYAGKPWNAMRDLRKNQSMAVFPTEAGFGSGDTELNVSDNPMLAETGLMWPYGSPDGPLKRVLANDLFRFVHDTAHGIEGAGFRADGEENAWQAHSRLFTGPALGALTSETRGQNSWLNFGPHGEKNKTAKVEDTIFADQKTGLMPEWTWTEGVARDEVYPEGAQMRFMPEYSGTHRAPDEENGSPFHEVTKGIYPDDFYSLPHSKAIQYYGSGDKKSDNESMFAIRAAKGNPDAPVNVYRAVPRNVGEEINPGDWVTPSRTYAMQHGESSLRGDYKILSKTVPASHLYTEGNSLSEFGYNPPKTTEAQMRFMPEAFSEMEGEVKPIPTQEELDAMKARLPKYTTKVEKVKTFSDGTTLIRLFDENSNEIGYSYVRPSKDNNSLQIDSVHLEGDYRNKGYGQALYREIAKYAQETGMESLTAISTSRLAASARSKIFETKWKGAGWDAESKVPANIRYMPEKLDAEHAAAFDAKDEQKARELVDEAAKAAGYKYRMYRGVENDYLKGDAYVFNKADETYFTSNKEKAESYAFGWRSSSSPDSGAVYDVYLKMENPWIPDRITDAQGWEYYDKKLREQGYDGVIGAFGGKAAAERGDIEVAVVFDPSQIKSADPFTYDNAGKLIPLSERFNMGTGDIRFMPSREEHQNELDQFSDKWKQSGVRISPTISSNGNIRPNVIVVPKQSRKQGIGTSVMEELVEIADKQGRRISISPSTDFGGSSVNRLKDFYSRFGFVENKGKNKDFTIRETMYREPNPVVESESLALSQSEQPTAGALAEVPALEGAQMRFSPDQEQEPARRMPMSAVDVLHSDSAILPKPIKKQSNAQIAIQLADVAERYHGQKITSSNITPEIESELVVNGANEAEAALKASGKNAANWYSTAIQAALKVAGIIHNVLTDLNVAKANQFFAKEPDPLEAANFALRLPLAITSQNMTVPLNARFAEEQFNTFQQTGKFDPSKKYGGKAKSISANLNLANEMIDKLGGIIELQKFVKQEFTVRELESAVSQLMGKKISISGRKDDMVNGAAIFGPKIGQGFLQNLMGKFDPVTIDLWMRRTWGRWTGDVVGDGVTGVRLGRMIQAFRDAGKQLPESIRRLKTVTRSPGVTETGKAKKPELTVTESVEDRIESDPEFRKDLERIAKETDAEFQKHYALMSAPMSEKLAKEIRAAMPVDPMAPTQSELEALDKAYRKAVKVQSEVAKSMDEKFADLTTDQKKALNPEDPKTAIKKDAWIAMEHAKEGRTEKLENPEKNLLKPEWAKAAKVIVAELNPINIPSDQDRMVISRVVNKIRETLERRGYTVTNADVQAILWYPEKDLWAKLAGKKESNLKQSYDDEFIKIAEQRGLGERARAVARDVRGY